MIKIWYLFVHLLQDSPVQVSEEEQSWIVALHAQLIYDPDHVQPQKHENGLLQVHDKKVINLIKVT